MAQQTINVGTAPNDGTGTPLRTAFQYTNSNFSELYTAVGPSGNNIVVPGTATITGNLTVNGSYISCGNNSYIRTDAANLFSIQTGSLGFRIMNAGNSALFYGIDSASTSTWYDGAGGTRMTLNSTGLGVGASPATRLHISNTGDVYARIATTSVSKAGVQFSANGVVRSHLLYDDGAGTTYLTTGTSFGGSGQALAIQSGTSLSIYTNNQLATAQMTLDASGRLFVGLTSSPYGTSRSWFSYDGGTVYGAGYKNITAGSGTAVVFVSSTNGLAGYISTTDTTVTYASVSDYRLKQDVKPLSGGLARVNALKPSIYKWKSDGSSAEGFIAHELAEVVPSAVIGSKDEVNEDGSIKAQGVDLSKVVPVLVAAIQELTARVQTLETR